MTAPELHGTTLVLFNFDWDRAGFARHASHWPTASAGFDLFSFPDKLRLAWFDLNRFVDRLARQAPREDWQAVTTSHEQFGALAAALLAERMGWPGTPVKAVLACQHKLHARRVLQEVCPEANPLFAPLVAGYGEPAPEGLDYPAFVKPVKAAFSVLARSVSNREELQRHTRFGAWELWIIRHLVEPFERVLHARLPGAGSAHRLLLEEPVRAPQYNLDGYVWQGEVRAIGVVDAVMYPGTQAFMRFDAPSRLDARAQARALDVARRFLKAVGFTHGLFNMEFFHDPATDRLTVIEFNPRMAAQLSDLYIRVHGVDLHRIALALAHGLDPAGLPRPAPTAGAASSFVYRAFSADAVPAMPCENQIVALKATFPDALLFEFPKPRGSMARDFKWLGSYRYGILHLGGADASDLRARCKHASALLGWPAPYADEPASEPAADPVRPERNRPESATPARLSPVLSTESSP
jgi:hypothetical protein